MATPSKMNKQLTGLDQFYAGQATPSQLERQQMNPADRQAWTDTLREKAPSLLGLAERGATPVGRSRHDPARIEERKLRAENRRLDRALSPFTYEQPQRMARNAVMGAMQGQNPPPPIFTRYY